MDTSVVLDTIGGLISQLKTYAVKLPAVVHMSVVPSGYKPQEEAVDDYERLVSRFRSQSGGTAYKGLNELFVDSLEAFEAGKLLGSIQPLLAVLDHLERMRQDNEIEVGRLDEKRLLDYRAALNKILPGNKPELDGAGRGL
ncbi:MAG TPA: hypothetical protein VEI50_08920 [Nitrospiraceae bacterium]|nr:hypothetical protein [Nitrospiraceae bacterium]